MFCVYVCVAFWSGGYPGFVGRVGLGLTPGAAYEF